MVSRRRRLFELFILILALLLGVSLLVGLGRDTGDSVAADSAGPGFDGSGRVVIRNVSLVLTMDPKVGEGPLGRLEDADVLIDHDRISAVGKDLPDDGAQVLDGHGKIVLPGFVDLHNHLWQALIRGCATDKDLYGWLSGCVLPLSGSSISGADGYAGAWLSTLDVISSGITTVTDWSHAFNADFARGNLRALEDSRLRFVFAYAADRQPATLAEIRRVKRELIDPNPLAHQQIGQLHVPMDDGLLERANVCLTCSCWCRLRGMTEVDPGPVVQRILLGADLRDAREAAGLSNAEASKALGWYTGKLSKIEQGDMKVNDKDLENAVRVYKISTNRAATLQQLAVEARRKLPPTRVPDHAVKYVNLERAATELKIFNGDCFPGTVQTTDYARAMLGRSVIVSPADVDRMAEDRAKRLERMKSPSAPRLWLVIGEEALYREIGGRAVLRAQLEEVRQLAELPHACVQIVPFDGGAHTSHGATFTIITLIEGRPGIVYVEGLTASDYLGREHVRIYNLAFENLRATTLSQQWTMEKISQRITELT